MVKTKLIEANKKGDIEITGVRPLDKYYLITGKDYILLKKVGEPSPLEQFDKLATEIQAKFKETGVKKSDIAKAIKWARRKQFYIYVSALGFDGHEREVVRRCLKGEIVLIVTEDILEEVYRVIEYPKFDFTSAQKDLLKLILGETGNLIAAPLKSSLLTEDPSDNKFLEAAVAGDADFLVTGDKHLLKLKRIGRTKILRAPEFLRAIQKSPVKVRKVCGGYDLDILPEGAVGVRWKS